MLAAACGLLAFLARTTGLIAFAAWAGEKLLKRDFRQAIVIAAIALIPAGLWMGYIHRVESSQQYTQPAYIYQHADYVYFNISYARQIFRLINPFRPEFGYLTPHSFARRVYSNIKRIPVEIGQSVFSWEGGGRLSLLVALAASGGLILQIARKRYVISLFVVLNLAAMCITPFPKQFVRYLLPLSPLIALSFFEMLAWLNAQSRGHFAGPAKWAAPLLSIALLALMGAEGLRDERELYLFHHDRIDYLHGGHRVSYRVFYYSPEERKVDQGLDWLQARAGRGDVVAATDPQWTYLRTGLKCVLPPLEASSGKAQRLMDSVPVRYLVVDENVYQRYTLNVVTSYPDLWKCVWQEGGGKVRIYERSNSGR